MADAVDDLGKGWYTQSCTVRVSRSDANKPIRVTGWQKFRGRCTEETAGTEDLFLFARERGVADLSHNVAWLIA